LGYQSTYVAYVPPFLPMSDIKWGAHCPFSGEHLGFFASRGDAEVAVWEAIRRWHGE
jgi:hypothetical protein